MAAFAIPPFPSDQTWCPMSLHTAIKSPCIKLCVIDEASGLCRGCGRTLEEIAGWTGLPDRERKRVMESLAGRLGRLEGARP